MPNKEQSVSVNFHGALPLVSRIMSFLAAILPLRLKLFLLHQMSRLKRAFIGRNIEALLINSYNGLFLVDVEDQFVGERLISGGEYGRGEVERLLSYATRTSTALVVGGHIGTIVVPLAKICEAVTVIEANPRTFRLLELNLLINRCSNVEAVNIAANDRSEELEFVLNRTNSGGSKRMPLVHDYVYFSDAPQTVRVNSTRLDDLLPASRFDLIVMDIEGSEYFALRGMPNLLSAAQVLSMEFTPHHFQKVSGITVEQLLEPISPCFSRMFVPSRGVSVGREKFFSLLHAMYQNDERDDGVIFTK